MLLRSGEPFYVSGFRAVEGLASVRLAVNGAFAPTYENRGAHPGRIRSFDGGAEAWSAPHPRWAIGLGGRLESWSEAHADGSAWSLRAAADRKTLPLHLYYHGGGDPSRPRFSALAGLLDGERGTWLAALSASGRGGSAPGWSAEIRLRRDRNQEKWSISAADADSARREWRAAYRDAAWRAEAYARGESGFGSLAGKGEYSWSRPDFGGQEYQIGDSSRSLRAGLELRPRPAFAGGGWSLRSEYAESQVFTEGLRLPPGAAGFKRFHHALGRAVSVYSGAEWERPGAHGALRFRAGAFHRYYRYRTSPHPDAYYERKETLSYNRLESSLLASLYGGFQQSAELVSADFRLRSFEFRPALAADFGRFGAELSAPAAYARLDARIAGETVSRKLLSVEVEREYAWGMRGPLAMAAPSLALRYRRGPATVSARASHAVMLWNGLRSGEGGAGPDTGDGDTQPWQGNAARWEAAATLDF